MNIKSISVWTPAIFIGVLFLAALIYFLTRSNYPANIAPVSTPAITPTEAARVISTEMDGYMISEGSLYKTSIVGDSKLIVDFHTLPSHDNLVVTEIFSFTESPDKTKILLAAYGGISAKLFYIHDISANANTFIDIGEEITWSPNSRYLAFTQRPADVGPLRLRVFDLQLSKKVELVQKENAITTSYSDLRWNDSSTGLIAYFETFSDVPMGDIIAKGETEVALKN
jgi:hypothetical protein